MTDSTGDLPEIVPAGDRTRLLLIAGGGLTAALVVYLVVARQAAKVRIAEAALQGSLQGSLQGVQAPAGPNVGLDGSERAQEPWQVSMEHLARNWEVRFAAVANELVALRARADAAPPVANTAGAAPGAPVAPAAVSLPGPGEVPVGQIPPATQLPDQPNGAVPAGAAVSL